MVRVLRVPRFVRLLALAQISVVAAMPVCDGRIDSPFGNGPPSAQVLTRGFAGDLASAISFDRLESSPQDIPLQISPRAGVGGAGDAAEDVCDGLFAP